MALARRCLTHVRCRLRAGTAPRIGQLARVPALSRQPQQQQPWRSFCAGGDPPSGTTTSTSSSSSVFGSSSAGAPPSSGGGAMKTAVEYHNILLEMANRKLPGEALKVLSLMQTNDVAHDVFAFNAAIVACHGQVDDAVRLLHEMEAEHDLKPNVVTLTAVIQSCEAAERFTEAMALQRRLRRLIDGTFVGEPLYRSQWLLRAHKQLTRLGCAATSLTYATLVRDLVDCGRWSRAQQIVRQMPKEGVKFAFCTVDTAAQACRAAGVEKRADEILALASSETMLTMGEDDGEEAGAADEDGEEVAALTTELPRYFQMLADQESIIESVERNPPTEIDMKNLGRML